MRPYLLAFCCSVLIGAHAQDAILVGTITDAVTKEPLFGATASWALGQGTSSDMDGGYRVVAPKGNIAVTFSMIGYEPLELPVTTVPGQETRLDAAMKPTARQLDQVVVSAGKFQQRVGEVTQSLSVLPTELVRNKNSMKVSEALDQVPGVIVIDEDPQIRSGSGFSYGAGSRVMLLVDDLPILSGDIGRAQWAFLPTENLEQIEVMKGASSVLYGSAALTGVINVRTAYPRKQPQTRINVFGGVYDTPGHEPAKWWDNNPPLFTGANFFHSQQFGRFDLVLGGNAWSDAGYVGPEPLPPDSIGDPHRVGPGGYENRVRFNIATRYRSKKIKGLSYGINANAMKSRSTSVFIWEDAGDNVFRPEPGTVTRTVGTQAYVDPYITYYSSRGTRHNIRGRWYRQIFENDNNQSNASDFLYGEYQIQQKVEFLGETNLTAGVTGQKTVSNSELYSGNVEGKSTNTAVNASAYLQVDKKLFDRLMLSGGVRYEHFKVNQDKQEQPVYRAGATCRLHKATYLRASYGQGYRFPTIGERFITTSVGQLNIYPNPGLQPEESWNLEGGLKQGFKLGKFTGYFDAVVFQQEYSNYIEFTFGQWGTVSIDNFLGLGFRSTNTGGARVTGYEFELAAKGMIGAVEVSTLMGYTHTLPVSTTPDYVYAAPTAAGASFPPSTYANTSYNTTDNVLKFRVEEMFRADVQANYKKLGLGFSVRYNSHVRNIDAVFVQLDEAPPPTSLNTGVSQWMLDHNYGDWIVDARIQWSLTDQVRGAFIVNNIGNEVYAIRPLSVEAPRSFQVMLTLAI
jgi:outer membrane receptor protein involved in Fe transport